MVGNTLGEIEEVEKQLNRISASFSYLTAHKLLLDVLLSDCSKSQLLDHLNLSNIELHPLFDLDYTSHI